MAVNLKYLILILSGFLIVSCSNGDNNDTATVSLTRQQGDAILEELKGIRKLLENMDKKNINAPADRKKTPRTATLDIGDDRPALGSSSAPVMVVEFTDYQCPFCRRFVHSTFPLLKRDFVETGKVYWQVRGLPLDFHSDARKAAQSVLCAREQDRFWQLRDSLFRNNTNLNVDNIKIYASELKLDMSAFNSCFDSNKYMDVIDRDIATARELRITGTPTFLIGRVKSGKLSGRLIVGAQSPAVFSAEINKLLKQK